MGEYGEGEKRAQGVMDWGVGSGREKGAWQDGWGIGVRERGGGYDWMDCKCCIGQKGQVWMDGGVK